VGIGVIGCGRWGGNLVRNFAELGALAAVSDISPDAAREYSDAYSVPSPSPSEFFDSDGIDAVAIAVPAEGHAELALRAIGRGMHVFVEKPIATKFSDAARLVDAARGRGRILMAGHVLRYHPSFVKLEKTVADGGIGVIRHIESVRGCEPAHYRGESAIWGFAPHDVSMILALMGELPNRVEAEKRVDGVLIGPDSVDSTLEFPSGASCRFKASWLLDDREQRLKVSGDGGALVFDDCRPWPSKLLRSGNEDEDVGASADSKLDPVFVAEAEPLKLECEHFLDCIETGRRPTTGGREALEVMRVLDAMNESARTGGPVFLGDVELGQSRPFSENLKKSISASMESPSAHGVSPG